MWTFLKLSLNNSSDVMTCVYCVAEISAEASVLTS